MLYIFALLSLCGLILSGFYKLVHMTMVSQPSTPTDTSSDLQSRIPLLAEALMMLSLVMLPIFGLMALIHYNSATTYKGSLQGLASKLSVEYPEFTGTLVCENEQLWVKGKVPLSIPYRNANHLFDYKIEAPQGSWGTSCILGIYPSASAIKENVFSRIDYEKNSILLTLNGGKPRHDRAPFRVGLYERIQMNQVVQALTKWDENLATVKH